MSLLIALDGGGLVDPRRSAALAALHALHEQSSGLAVVSVRLGLAADRVPRSAIGTWRGPAGDAFDVALRALRSTVASAEASVASAAAETRRAIRLLEASTG